MMMGNMGEVATLTDRLAMMPDNMLPRLAQQYKSDAITLSLILGEKNRRERVRSSMKAQAGAQPQPKVNDQVVASMQPQLPEQVGIGALPAPNMQQMADGGIAGYADGDLVYHNEPVVRMAEGGVPRYNGEKDSLVAENPFAIGSMYRRWKESGKPLLPYLGLETTRPVQYYPESTISGSGPSNAEIERQIGLTPQEDKAASDKTAPKAGAASTKTDYSVLDQFGPKRTTSAPRAPAAATPTDFASVYDRIFKATPGEDPAAKERTALGEELVAGAEGRLKRLKEDQAARGDVYKGREERLTQREQELEKSAGKNTGLALLEAGLAIMSTPGHWAQAVGKGAQVGTARYAEGLDKLRAAKERLSDARDRMEDLRINRDDMNARELRQANNEIDAAKVDARKLGIEGIMAAAGVKEKRAGAMFDATVRQAQSREEMASRERIAGMEVDARLKAASVPGANERIALLLGGGDLAKGLERLTSIQAGKFNPMNAYTEYLSKRKEGDTTLSPIEFVNQIRSVSALMAGTPAASDTPTGKVRD